VPSEVAADFCIFDLLSLQFGESIVIVISVFVAAAFKNLPIVVTTCCEQGLA
jgi:hypothetical protein